MHNWLLGQYIAMRQAKGWNKYAEQKYNENGLTKLGHQKKTKNMKIRAIVKYDKKKRKQENKLF